MTGPVLRRSPVAALVEMAGFRSGEIVSHRVEGDLHRLTRTELATRARRLAGALAAAGLAAGDHIATLAWTGHRHLEIAFAAGGSGIIAQALDPGLHPDAIVRAALGPGVRMVFFDLTFMPLIEEIAPRLPAATRFVALTDRPGMPIPAAEVKLACYEDLLAGAPDRFDWPMLDDETLARLSTRARDGELPPPRSDPRADPGAAGGIGHEHEHEHAGQAELGGAEIVLSAMPMARDGGWSVLVAAWQAGATLVLAGPWLDGGSLRALAESEGVTVVAAPPRLLQGLRARIERDGAVLPRLRRAIVGRVAGDAGCLEIVAVYPERDPRAA